MRSVLQSLRALPGRVYHFWSYLLHGIRTGVSYLTPAPPLLGELPTVTGCRCCRVSGAGGILPILTIGEGVPFWSYLLHGIRSGVIFLTPAPQPLAS